MWAAASVEATTGASDVATAVAVAAAAARGDNEAAAMGATEEVAGVAAAAGISAFEKENGGARAEGTWTAVTAGAASVVEAAVEVEAAKLRAVSVSAENAA